MTDSINNLSREINKIIKRAEHRDKHLVQKSTEASDILVEIFSKLREFIIFDLIKDQPEESMHFPKQIKLKSFYWLIYYRKTYNIGINCPVSYSKSPKEHLIYEYIYKQPDFIRCHSP